jgi:hypothetical protein
VEASIEDSLLSFCSVDLSALLITWFVKNVLFDDDKEYEKFQEFQNMCSNLIDCGYVFVIGMLVNTFRLTQDQSVLVALACAFCFGNTIFGIRSSWRILEGDICNLFGLLIGFQLCIAFAYIVFFGRDIFYASHGWPSYRPDTAGNYISHYTSLTSTIDTFLSPSYGTQFPDAYASDFGTFTLETAQMNGAYVDGGPKNAAFCL